MERRCSVYDDFERRIRLDCLVESSSFGNVLHYHEVEFVLGDFEVIVQDLLTFLFRSDGCNDRVAAFEQYIEDMGSYEA